MNRVFAVTASFDKAIVELFDLLYPLAAGLWTLRTGIAGYLVERPEATETELAARFVTGSGMRFGNLRAVVRPSWSEHQEELAEFGLVAVCGMYEAWALAMASLWHPASPDALADKFQWPPRATRPVSRRRAGIDSGLAELRADRPRHADAMAAIRGAVAGQRGYAGTRLGDLATAYRAMKEVRNAIAHRGATASEYTAIWVNHARGLTPRALGLKRPLMLVPLAPGDSVHVTLDQVQALVRIVIQMATVLDTEAAVSRQGEQELLRRYAVSPGRVEVVQARRSEWDRHVRNVLAQRGLPTPQRSSMAPVVTMLRSEGLIRE